MTDYGDIFNRVEASLLRVGTRTMAEADIRRNLDTFKDFEGKTFSDAEYYWKLVQVVFYSGFKASTISSKLDVIRGHFPGYETVAGYGDAQVAAIANDPTMVRNIRKILACVGNAKTFQAIVRQHGSFQAYIESFAPGETFENLMLLKEELEYRFKGLGRVTTYHLLTDIGMDVLKPDRVICRIFRRLGLIESDEQLLKAVIQGRKFAKAAQHPIRYIDIVFVAYGQMESKEFGLERGICLENDPSCHICGIKDVCHHFARIGP